MTMTEIINKIKTCETRAGLDLMRLEIVEFISESNDVDVARMVQSAFIKQKNKLRRHGR